MNLHNNEENMNLHNNEENMNLLLRGSNPFGSKEHELASDFYGPESNINQNGWEDTSS
jgi:hypothetical protein